MNRTVLLTAAKEDTETVKSGLEKRAIKILHFPLEHYAPVAPDAIEDTFEQIDGFENIVHGSKRNALFFVEKAKEFDKLEEVRQRLNLAMDQLTANYLEEQGIAAVHPEAEGKAINLLEFMLRVRRMGKTLYPCGDKTSEDLPGLLQELDIPVEALVLFTLKGPEDEELKQYRQEIAAGIPGAVIFHSRRSVNRTLAAFPELDLSAGKVVSADKGITDKLKKKGIAVTAQADGNWESVIEKAEEVL